MSTLKEGTVLPSNSKNHILPFIASISSAAVEIWAKEQKQNFECLDTLYFIMDSNFRLT